MQTEREKLIAWCEGKLNHHGKTPGRYFYRKIADALRETTVNELVALLKEVPGELPCVTLESDGSGHVEDIDCNVVCRWGSDGLNAYDTIRAYLANRRGDQPPLDGRTVPYPTQRADGESVGATIIERLNEFAETLEQAAAKCPKCGSPDPKLHPAVQFEGEVQICDNAFHTPLPPPAPADPHAALSQSERDWLWLGSPEVWLKYEPRIHSSTTGEFDVLLYKQGHVAPLSKFTNKVLAEAVAAARAWVEEHERPKHQWQRPSADTPVDTPVWCRDSQTAPWKRRYYVLADPASPETPPPADWAGE